MLGICIGAKPKGNANPKKKGFHPKMYEIKGLNTILMMIIILNYYTRRT